MAYREHGMWEVLEVLRRAHAGEPYRAIERGTGRSRKSIRRYLRSAAGLGWKPGGVAPPDEDLACRVAARLRPGPVPDEQSGNDAVLLPHLEQLRKWLVPAPPDRRGLTLTKAHILLEGKGVRVGYSALHRFAHKHLDFGRHRTTVRMADCEPGEVVEVDFGRLGMVPDSETGKRRVLHALVVTLVFSRHQYVHVTHSQALTDLIGGLEDAWEFFGGCPRRLILDNMKTAVTKADRYDPVFQRTFDEYARYRGMVIDAAGVREPKHKPHVERQVPYVRENFFRGEQFLHRDDVQRRALAWCLGRAGNRLHGTTRKLPLAQFEQLERQALLPLTIAERFDVPNWAEPKVHPDCHIRYGNALYSVPYTYIGKTVTVRGDRALVRIYCQGQRIKLHARQPPGGRSTDYADYPPEKSEYAMRDPDRIIARATAHDPQIGHYVEQLLAGDFPWAKLRQAQNLLRLVDKFGARRVADACARSVSFDLINVRRLQTMLERALEAEAKPVAATPGAGAKVIQLPLRFARPAASFRHADNTTNADQTKEIENGD